MGYRKCEWDLTPPLRILERVSNKNLENSYIPNNYLKILNPKFEQFYLSWVAKILVNPSRQFENLDRVWIIFRNFDSSSAQESCTSGEESCPVQKDKDDRKWNIKTTINMNLILFCSILAPFWLDFLSYCFWLISGSFLDLSAIPAPFILFIVIFPHW